VVEHLPTRHKAPDLISSTEEKNQLGVVAHACHPSTQEAEVGGLSLRPAQATQQEPVSKNNK
jgi:aminopeptidase-like protein